MERGSIISDATFDAADPSTIIGLIDATDLPAATNEYKKKTAAGSLHIKQHWEDAPKRPDRVDGSSAIKNALYGFG
jgi:hypothetical protein